MMRVVGIIPARFASSRFPGKPLVDILGLPMIIHTMKRSQMCEALDDVFVATDSSEIADVVAAYGGKYIITSDRHPTGTDRIAEAAGMIDCDIVVNIQGDEPLVMPEHIAAAVAPLTEDSKLQVSTLLLNTEHFNDLTDCKVVLDETQNILYMSRADIPSPARTKVESQLKLYCIVPFRKDFLFQFAAWEQTPLEKIEFIEYLRILEKGYKMRGVLVEGAATSVDYPEDVPHICTLMQEDPLFPVYRQKS